MFACTCGKFAFYSDEMVLLNDNIIEVNDVKQLEVVRKLKYYTCINCDKRWLYNISLQRFVLADGGEMF